MILLRRLRRAMGGPQSGLEPAGPRSNLAWKLNRLRAMGPPEVLWRIGRSARGAMAHLRDGVGAVPDAPLPAGRCGQPWVERIPTQFEAGPYVAAARRILAGRFDIFALRPAVLGFPPEWNRDPRTGTRAPMTFGAAVDYRNETEVGDIKYLWELNRHLEVVTLGQAFHLSGDPRFASGVRELLGSWFVQCPYPRGVNWTSALEHAVRLVNWSYAWHLLGGDGSAAFEGADGERFRQDWMSAVYRHLRFIRGHLSRFSSANNHLLGEYMGLFVGTTTWPLWRECDRWRSLAARGLEIEADRQIGADGVNREQAVWYEHETADMLLHCGLAARAAGTPLGGGIRDRLLGMLEHLASIMDVAGHVPMSGDSDDALMVRLSQEPDFDPYRSLLATGAVLFDRPDFKFKAGRFDDKSRWLLGDRAAARFDAMPARSEALPVRRAFPEGGYWILGDRLETEREVRLVADAGALGYLSLAAHGHADALSFTLSVAGREILVDPGTYAYHTRRKWRDYFRGTSAHNTLRVSGRDQSLPGGSFLWLRHARAQCHAFTTAGDRDQWEASHDGYLRLREPVRHRRRIVLDKGGGTIEVVDVLQGTGVHRVEQFWHFAEQCTVARNAGSGFDIRHGALMLRLIPPEALEAMVIRGDEIRPLGWVSRRLDEKTPTHTLLCEGVVEAGAELRTVISYDTAFAS